MTYSLFANVLSVTWWRLVEDSQDSQKSERSHSWDISWIKSGMREDLKLYNGVRDDILPNCHNLWFCCMNLSTKSDTLAVCNKAASPQAYSGDAVHYCIIIANFSNICQRIFEKNECVLTDVLFETNCGWREGGGGDWLTAPAGVWRVFTLNLA